MTKKRVENQNYIKDPMHWGIIQLPKITDTRGNLSFVQSNDQIPFDLQRAYFLYDVPGGEARGAHGHKKLQQLMIAISGSFGVSLTDGKKEERFTLNRAYEGLYIPAGTWRVLDNFSSGSVCLVLASEKYSEDDYIREYTEFLQFKSQINRT